MLGASIVIGAVGLVLRAWSPGSVVRTTDETRWVQRSLAFGEALRVGDVSGMTTGPLGEHITRPGITTMWLGHAGFELADSSLPFVGDLGGLDVAQALVAVVCGIALVPFVLVAARVVGGRAAIVAGGLLAVEPFAVAHSRVLHTDGMVTAFVAVALVGVVATTAEAAREARGEVEPTRSRAGSSTVLAVVTGLFAALAVLTKISAVVVLAPAAVVPVVALASAWRDPARGAVARRLGRATVLVVVVGAVTAAVLWPAILVDPFDSARALADSTSLADRTSQRFFLGHVRSHGDARFYVVTSVVRSSAWFVLLGGAALGWLVTCAVRRADVRWPEPLVWCLIAPVGVYAFAITVSEKQYDRYALPIVPVVSLVIGTAVAQLVAGLGGRAAAWLRATGWIAFAGVALWTASLAPHALAHVNPLVGGERAAERIPLGWGEGKEWVLDRLDQDRRARGGARCPRVAVRGGLLLLCGREDFDWIDGSKPPPDYVVVYVYERQRGRTVAEDRWLAEHGQLVDELVIDGVTYAEIWRPASAR